MDAVVPRQVRTGLRRRDDVVGADRVGAVRERNFDQLRSEFLQDFRRFAHGRRDLGVEPLSEELLHQADPHRLQRALGDFEIRLRRRGKAGRIARIVAGDDFHEERRVADVLGDRADLVERRGERDQTVAGDAAVGRLEPDHAAERGRLADGAAGVRAEREMGHVGGDGGGRAAAGTARDPGRVPRISRGAEGRILRRGTHGEFVEVRFPDQDRAVAPETFDHVGVVGRREVLEDFGGAGGRKIGGADVVLHGDGHAGEAAEAFAAGERRVNLGGPRQRRRAAQREIGVQRRLKALDAREEVLRRLARRDFLLPNPRRQFQGGQLVQFARHAVTGTKGTQGTKTTH